MYRSDAKEKQRHHFFRAHVALLFYFRSVCPVPENVTVYLYSCRLNSYLISRHSVASPQRHGVAERASSRDELPQAGGVAAQAGWVHDAVEHIVLVEPAV